MRTEIRYLNTDLDLISDQDLTPLTVALENGNLYTLTVHQREDKLWCARLEINDDHPTPEETIANMLNAIEHLTGTAHTLWTQCSLREFNIGYDCGDRPQRFNNGISSQTILRIGNADASLRITLYPPEIED